MVAVFMANRQHYLASVTEGAMVQPHTALTVGKITQKAPRQTSSLLLLVKY